MDSVDAKLEPVRASTIVESARSHASNTLLRTVRESVNGDNAGVITWSTQHLAWNHLAF